LLAFRKAGLHVKAVEGDRQGMDPECLTTALYRYRPKLVYVSFACSDPEGLNWSPERRQAAKERCREAGVPLATDDRQELLPFDSEDHSHAKILEPGVLSIGQLPPGLIAGLHLGWIAGTFEDQRERMAPMSLSKEPQASDIEYRALSELIGEQPLEPLILMLRSRCRERMKIMTELLSQRKIPDLAWVTPKGGLHLWVQLPGGLDGESLLRGSWLKGLIFQPGKSFYSDHPQPNTVRLTYAFADERQMKLGISRLAESIEEFTGRWSIS
jgi:2-aminoadipate transaminase